MLLPFSFFYCYVFFCSIWISCPLSIHPPSPATSPDRSRARPADSRRQPRSCRAEESRVEVDRFLCSAHHQPRSPSSLARPHASLPPSSGDISRPRVRRLRCGADLPRTETEKSLWFHLRSTTEDRPGWLSHLRPQDPSRVISSVPRPYSNDGEESSPAAGASTNGPSLEQRFPLFSTSRNCCGIPTHRR